MEDPFWDAGELTVIMEALLDIRRDLDYVIWLLEGDGEQEAEENS